jgi:hypothetical protein
MLICNKCTEHYCRSCHDQSVWLLLWPSFRGGKSDDASHAQKLLTKIGHLCRLQTLPSRYQINSTVAGLRVCTDWRIFVPGHHRPS